MEKQQKKPLFTQDRGVWYRITVALLLLAIAVATWYYFKPIPEPYNDFTSTNLPIVTSWEDVVQTQSEPIAIQFRATWTEPFWSFDFLDGSALFMSPNVITGVIYSWFTITANTSDTYIFVNPDGMRVTVSSNASVGTACSDGMSEQQRDGYIIIRFPDGQELANWCVLTDLFQQQ